MSESDAITGFGDVLRQARESKQISIEELAQKLGWQKSRLEDYESGKTQPTPDSVDRIAEALGLSSVDLQTLYLFKRIPDLRSAPGYFQELVRQNIAQTNIPTVRAKIEEILVIEITQSELEELKRGGPESLLLNFAFATTSCFVSFLIVLLTVQLPLNRITMFFQSVTLVMGLSTTVLFTLWLRLRRRRWDVLDRIEQRIRSKFHR